MGPVRARSERYYRYQELDVNEIDSDGSNLPMFLSSLRPAQLREFSEYVMRTFGFGVTIDRHEGHLSISLVYPDEKSNIVDSGFGVSQILPVLAQLWWAASNYRASRFSQFRTHADTYLAIEQPELHLHPAHQALLADVFASVIKESAEGRSNVKLLIETHSEQIINRLGALVENGDLAGDQVQIVIFEDRKDQTDYRLATFNSDGALSNWPSGFFAAEV